MVLLNLSHTPLSLIRLPSIRQPIKGAVEGSSRIITIATITGKSIFSVLDTGRSCFITMLRSFLVVSNFIMGGCIKGTNAI